MLDMGVQKYIECTQVSGFTQSGERTSMPLSDIVDTGLTYFTSSDNTDRVWVVPIKRKDTPFMTLNCAGDVKVDEDILFFDQNQKMPAPCNPTRVTKTRDVGFQSDYSSRPGDCGLPVYVARGNQYVVAGIHTGDFENLRDIRFINQSFPCFITQSLNTQSVAPPGLATTVTI
jgi:hypothetical protein